MGKDTEYKQVIVYIDGFNLYHSIKQLGNNLSYLKWQNLSELPKHYLLNNEQIIKIKFFTAYPKWKKESCKRHREYVKILKDLNIEVILGRFRQKQVYCDKCQTTIIKHEEKETDVNIATHIMSDLYEYKPDIIQLISGDTDLVPPLKIAKQKGAFLHLVQPIGRQANYFDSIVDKKSKMSKKQLEKYFLGQTYTTKDKKIFECPYLNNNHSQ